MKLIRLLAGLAPALVLPSLAIAVPIASDVNDYFYSFQLQGLSYGPNGESVDVHVFDATFDASAYGSLIITDETTSTTLFDFTSGNYGTYDSPGSFTTDAFLLPYGDTLSYSFAGQEFSGMDIIFGDTVVASGGTAYGQYPTYTTSEVITNPNASVPDETATLTLVALALAGLVILRRRAEPILARLF